MAAATWTANWRFVAAEQAYADLFALPSPFQHFWSLAVEEQFYVVLPLVLAGLGRRAVRLRTGRLGALLVGLIALSTWQAARLTRPAKASGTPTTALMRGWPSSSSARCSRWLWSGGTGFARSDNGRG